jgi:hypothetical protein
LEAHPEARLYNRNQNDYGISAEDKVVTDALPWTRIPDVDPHNTDDICFKTEAFCGVIAETALEADGTSEFLHKAVEFANQNVWGTLAVTLLVPQNVESDKATGAGLTEAIADLRYGTVCINRLHRICIHLHDYPLGKLSRPRAIRHTVRRRFCEQSPHAEQAPKICVLCTAPSH